MAENISWEKWEGGGCITWQILDLPRLAPPAPISIFIFSVTLCTSYSNLVKEITACECGRFPGRKRALSHISAANQQLQQPKQESLLGVLKVRQLNLNQ